MERLCLALKHENVKIGEHRRRLVIVIHCVSSRLRANRQFNLCPELQPALPEIGMLF